jgi:hypothetical protein
MPESLGTRWCQPEPDRGAVAGDESAAGGDRPDHERQEVPLAIALDRPDRFCRRPPPKAPVRMVPSFSINGLGSCGSCREGALVTR